MKKILLISSLVLLFINVKAINFSSVNASSGTTFQTNPSYPTVIGIDFAIATNPTLTGEFIKVQMIYTPESGPEEVVKDNEYQMFSVLQPSGYLWNSRIEGTLAAGKTKGKISLKLFRWHTSGPLTENSTTTFRLNDGTTTPTDPNPVDPRWRRNTFYDRYGDQIRVVPGYIPPPEFGSINVLYPNPNAPVLNVDQAIYSLNRQYFFILQSDGNLVLYTANWKVLWTADTNGKGGQYLHFQPDGNLVLSRNIEGTSVVWASNIYNWEAKFDPTPNRMFYILQDDGNLVFYWDGVTETVRLGDTGTSGGRKSNHFGKIN